MIARPPTRRPPRPIALAFGLGLIALGLPAGCTPPPPPPKVDAPTAPVVPKVTAKASIPGVKFVEITAEAGIGFRHVNAARGDKLLPETMGSGAAFFDADGDGDPDLFLVNSARWPGAPDDGRPEPTQAFYLNDGKGHFADATKAAGLDRTVFGMGAAVGDYDNDGDVDLYVTALGGNTLFRNDGKGHFDDATAEAGARGSDGWYTSAAFLDVDNDGDLDLFACCYVTWSAEIDRGITGQIVGKGRSYDPPASYGGSHCLLLRNDGGRFVDISAESGIQVKSPDRQVPLAKSLGVAPMDVDGDGRVDIAVANDTVVNFFFRNLGGGKFDEIGLTTGIAFDQSGATRAGMGADWGDILGDGSLALAIGNYANEMTALYFADRPKALIFRDLANIYGLGAPTQPPLKFGLFFFDYDLDGRLDLLTANGHVESDIGLVQGSETYAQSAQLFWNSGRRGRELFALVDPARAGPDLFRPIVGRGCSYADVDGDGDLDVLITENGGPAHLYRNDGGDRNHWIRLELRGRASNRDAIGARVAVVAGPATARRQLFTSKGYLSSVEHPLTFGLGGATRADSIRVDWPSGRVTELGPVEAGRICVIDEESGLTKP